MFKFKFKLSLSLSFSTLSKNTGILSHVLTWYATFNIYFSDQLSLTFGFLYFCLTSKRYLNKSPYMFCHLSVGGMWKRKVWKPAILSNGILE